MIDKLLMIGLMSKIFQQHVLPEIPLPSTIDPVFPMKNVHKDLTSCVLTFCPVKYTISLELCLFFKVVGSYEIEVRHSYIMYIQITLEELRSEHEP